MFLFGFICGIALLMLLVALCDNGEDRVYNTPSLLEQREMQSAQSWQQTRNFLYYDGTEMPLKKEDIYE